MHQGSDFLFVYGTLRRGAGHAMGEWLGERADWQGEAWCEAARLYRVSWYPALQPGRADERVRGDLFRLREAAAIWPALDAFEGVAGKADDEYERRPRPVRLDDGRQVEAWCYWYRREVTGLLHLPAGDWLVEGRPP